MCLQALSLSFFQVFNKILYVKNVYNVKLNHVDVSKCTKKKQTNIFNQNFFAAAFRSFLFNVFLRAEQKAKKINLKLQTGNSFITLNQSTLYALFWMGKENIKFLYCFEMSSVLYGNKFLLLLMIPFLFYFSFYTTY